MTGKVLKTDAEWRASLTRDAYRVTRQGATEAPFSHPGFPTGPGHFACVCCGATLFDSDDRFASTSGWPSFSRASAAVETVGQRAQGSAGVEVRCRECDAHLGHLFEDGPPPDGRRYCINGVALSFVPDR